MTLNLRLSANLKLNAVSCFAGIVLCTTTGLNTAAYTMVVTCAVLLEAVTSKKSDGVFRGAEAKTSSITGDLSFGDIICSLATEEEAIMAEDSVSSEDWALIKESQQKLR